MIRFLRCLQIALGLYKGTGVWAGDSEWADSDAIALAHYLSGESGQRFKARLRNISIEMNARAVLSPDPSGDGRKAAGFMTCIEFISALSVPENRETNEEEDSPSSYLEPVGHMY